MIVNRLLPDTQLRCRKGGQLARYGVIGIDMWWPTLGSEVRRRRTALKMNQEDLGEAIGKNQRWVSQLENDRIKFPDPYVFRQLANALHANPTDILRAIGYAEDTLEVENGVQVFTMMMDLSDRADVPDYVREMMRHSIIAARTIHQEHQRHESENEVAE